MNQPASISICFWFSLLPLANAGANEILNARFEDRPNTAWISTQIASTVQWIENIGGGQCSVLWLAPLKNGCASAEQFSCVFAPNASGYATLEFKAARGDDDGNCTVIFNVPNHAFVLNGIPYSGSFVTYRISIPVLYSAGVYVLFGAQDGHPMMIDDVSVCWTEDDQTSRSFVEPARPVPPPNCGSTTAYLVAAKRFGCSLPALSCPTIPCPWDLNGDGLVDEDDFDLLMAKWGTCSPDCSRCPEDLDGDGDVDDDDLDELLRNFGPCP